MEHFWAGFEKQAGMVGGAPQAVKPAQAMTNWKPAALSTLGQRPIPTKAPPLPAFGEALKGLRGMLNQRLRG